MEKVKKVVVFGVGRMGTAICHAMNKLGYYVIGVDTNNDAADNFRGQIKREDGVFYNCDERDYKDLLIEFENPEVVISSLPYHQTQPLAEFCIDAGIRYCDLGGRVDVSENINNHAKGFATKPVMTDLGLAPGWVNILAEQGYHEIGRKINSVEMMVGGLPARQEINPPFNYAVTWSVDGLINEYKDDCEVLVNGEVKMAKGMDGLQNVYSDRLFEELEAFYTSGGASHTINTMKERGVKNCSYKTLRYKGHRDPVKFLIRDCNLSDDVMTDIFTNGCPPDPFGDIVIIKAVVKSGDIKFDKEILVGYNDGFSAMQRATAFSISSVAALMAEGVFDPMERKNLAYSDIPFEDFNKNLKALGV